MLLFHHLVAVDHVPLAVLFDHVPLTVLLHHVPLMVLLVGNHAVHVGIIEVVDIAHLVLVLLLMVLVRLSISLVVNLDAVLILGLILRVLDLGLVLEHSGISLGISLTLDKAWSSDNDGSRDNVMLNSDKSGLVSHSGHSRGRVGDSDSGWPDGSHSRCDVSDSCDN